MQVAIQVVTVVVRAMMEEDLSTKPHTRRSIPAEQHRPRQARPMLSQPVFNWKAPDMYVELLNFEMEVGNMPQVKAYDLSEQEKVPIIKNWLGKEGRQFIQSLTNIEKEACKSATGLIIVLKGTFRPQHNEMILSLQYYKMHRKEYEST